MNSLLRRVVAVAAVLVVCCSVASAETQGFRGTFLDLTADPWSTPKDTDSIRLVPDELLVVEDGVIRDFGPHERLRSKYPGMSVTEFRDRIVVPGFIDCYVHYPQTRVIAQYGESLLGWLKAYIFPEELKFSDRAYADQVARQFFDLVLRSGTTTVQSFATTSPVSVEAFFDEATRRNMRVISGLTGLDRKGQAPDAYLDTAEAFYKDSRRLIERYHERGRNLYAITPRFALGSTPEQLAKCGQLKREFPTTFVNTHLAENPFEVREVQRLFPDAKDYLGVYEKYGLVGPRFTGGHAIYMDDDMFRRMHDADASIAFCPSSNLFLGSGLFRISDATRPDRMVRFGLGTDLGAGNAFSLIHAADDAYKVGMLNTLPFSGGFNLQDRSDDGMQRTKVGAVGCFYLMTLGGARALHLESKLGSFDVGKEADFVVLDPKATPALAARAGDMTAATVEDAVNLMFGVIMLGDDRCVDGTYVMGQAAYRRE